MTNILTTAELAQYAPDLDTTGFSDTTLSGIISQATNRIAKFCNVKGFEQATETDETDRTLISNKGELVIAVRRRPIVSVSAISIVRGGFSTNLTLTDSSGNALYQIPTPGNRLHLPNAYLYATGTYLAGGSSQLYTLKGANTFYKITYIGGYAQMPDDLKQACVLYMRDIITKQFNPTGAQSFSQGSYSVNFGAGTADGDSRLIKEAKDILMQGSFVRVELQ